VLEKEKLMREKTCGPVGNDGKAAVTLVRDPELVLGRNHGPQGWTR